MMLEKLTPLEETKVGKELIEIGEERGVQKGRRETMSGSVLDVAEVRLGHLPRSVQSRIQKLTLEQSRRLLKFVAGCNSLAEVRTWLDQEAR